MPRAVVPVLTRSAGRNPPMTSGERSAAIFAWQIKCAVPNLKVVNFSGPDVRDPRLSSVLLSVFSLRFSAYLRDLCVETAVNAEVPRGTQRYAENRRETLLKFKTPPTFATFCGNTILTIPCAQVELNGTQDRTINSR